MIRAPMLAIAVLSSTGCDAAARASEVDPPAEAPPSVTVGAPPEAHGSLVFVRERAAKRTVFRLDLRTLAVEPLVDRSQDDYAGPVHGTSLLVVGVEHRGELQREQLWRWHDGALSTLGRPSHTLRNPTWLPDGSGAIYESDREAFRELYLATSDGEARRLTTTRTGAFEPSVHPDGLRVAYVTSDDGDPDVLVARIDGSAPPRRLTWGVGDDTAPQWSPDGGALAWVRVHDGEGRIHVMEEDGRHPHALAAPLAGHRAQSEPRWSPDGQRLAFVERGPGKRSTIRVVGRDGAPVTDTGDDAVCEGAAWSPDGALVAFSSDRSGDAELYVLRVADGATFRLTDDPGPDWLPRWLPATATSLTPTKR